MYLMGPVFNINEFIPFWALFIEDTDGSSLVFRPLVDL